MKKRIISLFSSCLLAFSIIATGCDSITEYSISVINGTGGGVFEKGSTATITATVPANKEFDYWTLNNEQVSNSNPYSFTVTVDATYTAVFKSQQATVTVINGTGGGTYDVGTPATVTATVPTNKEFVRWTIDGVEVSKSNPYIFIVSQDVTLTAEFKTQQATVNVVNGTGGGTFDKGTVVTIEATVPNGKLFNYWLVDGVKGPTENPFTFIVSKNVTYTACFKSETVAINVIDGSGSGNYEVGSSVTIKAGAPQEFYTFDYWECDGQNVSTSNPYTFTATKNATYKAIYKVVKNNRGSLVTSPTNFDITPITVSDGGTITIDYKFVDPVTDKNNAFSIFFGTDTTNCYGKYQFFYDHSDKTYEGVTSTTLVDDYIRLVFDISKLNEIRSGCVAPTTISKIIFRWVDVTQGVYIDINHQSQVVKTNEFQMSDSEFVIANFTDIHVDSESLLSDTGTTGKTIKYGIENSKPDILLFSGDIAGSSSDLGYICSYLDSFEIPYFFILGNHDHEGSLGFNTIAQKVNQSKYGYIEKGPTDLGTEGNYTIKIKNSTGSLVHSIIMMDTGNKYTVTDDSLVEYVTNPVANMKYGSHGGKTTYCSEGWNGLRGKQIDWYETTAESLNCESTLVCHIPFLEYAKAYEAYQDAKNKNDADAIAACAPIGRCSMGEQVCGSIENLGMFARIKKVGLTKNVICGHDHANDFSLMYQDVRLTYALKTGEGSYWKEDGTRCGYTELKINSSGNASLNQIYFNPNVQ